MIGAAIAFLELASDFKCSVLLERAGWVISSDSGEPLDANTGNFQFRSLRSFHGQFGFFKKEIIEDTEAIELQDSGISLREYVLYEEMHQQLLLGRSRTGFL